jgi:hypothetical protein
MLIRKRSAWSLIQFKQLTTNITSNLHLKQALLKAINYEKTGGLFKERTMKKALLILALAVILLSCKAGNYSSNSIPSASTQPSSSPSNVSSTPKYTWMNRMNALEFAVTVSDYEEKVPKIASYSLSVVQKKDAEYIKGMAKSVPGRMILGALSGGVQMLAWSGDSTGVADFYFQPK